MRINRRMLWLLLPGLILFLLFNSLVPVFAQPEKTDLILYITGAFPSNVTPGQDSHFFLGIRNNGNATITNIRFNANAPMGWTVNFAPTGLDSLNAGSSNTINVDIIPAKSSSKGNYDVTMIAEANETRAVTDTMLTIEGGISFWVWVGAGVAALVIIGFVIVFLRFNKQ